MPNRYRADHVGSFLRPPELTDAFRAFRQHRITDEQLRKATDQAILNILQTQKDAGLDIFSDGEYRRGSWLSGPLDAFEGFIDAGAANRDAPQNQTRWRGAPTEAVPMQSAPDSDPDAKRRQRVIGGRIKAKRRLNGEEAGFLAARAPGPYKITNPGPTWFLRYWAPGVSDKDYASRDEALADLVAIMKDEISTLVNDGVPYIQIDSIRYVFDYTDEERRAEWRQWGVDPDAAIEQDVSADNALIEGLRRDGVTFGLHMCRGNFYSRWYAEGGYNRIAERVFPRLNYDRFLLEYDTERAGDFAPLRFVPRERMVVLGLISTKSPKLEDPDAIRRRVEEASKFVPLDNLALSGQCGFASVAIGNELSWDDQRRKLDLIVGTARKIWGRT
jgi:5-methyltetrahydropteroyltriglutamate--homocysteine methyltransferase